MINWTACAIGFVIGFVLGRRSIKRTNGPIITHKCSVCGKNYWTRGGNQP